MKQICSQADVARLGTIMSVWAHPDDETFLAGGLLRAAILNGQEVICVTATRGEAGVRDQKRWPPKRLGQIRARELKQAFRILGIKNHHFLDYKDGQCYAADAAVAAKKIRQFINRYRPDTILTFGPEGWTGHDDHKTVSRWVEEAVGAVSHAPRVFHGVVLDELYDEYYRLADKTLNIFFNIKKPPVLSEARCSICLRLDGQLCADKCAALAAMPSQTEDIVAYFGDEYLKEAFSAEAFVLAKSDAV